MATRKLGSSSWFVFLIALCSVAPLVGCDGDGGPTAPAARVDAPDGSGFDPRGPATTTAVPGPVSFDHTFEVMASEGCSLPGVSYARFTRRMASPVPGTYPLTSDAGFEACNDAPEDAANRFTWSQEGGVITWSATVPVGAVILQSGSASRVYQYSLRSWGDEGLASPTDASTGAPLSVDAVVISHDYAVSVDAQVQARLVRRVDWSVQGMTAGTSWDLFGGDAAVSRVELQLTAGAPVNEPPTAVGVVTITNTSPLPARISSVTNFFSGGYLIPISFPVNLPVDLLPGQSLSGNYWQPLPNQQTRSNNVTVNCVGDVRGGSARAVLEFGERVDEHATATVVSSDGRTFGPYATSDVVSIEREFSVGHDDPAVTEVPWTFGLVEDQGGYATTITLRRHDPALELGAQSRFLRRWGWFLAHGSQSEGFLTHTTSRESVRSWMRAWTDAGTDTDFGVSGTLHLTNPHPSRPLQLTTSSLSVGSVTRPGFRDDATIEALADRAVEFDLALADGAAVEVTAIVGYRTHIFAPDGEATPRGVGEFRADVALDFDRPTSEIDAEVWLGDTLVGDLGRHSAAQSPIVVEYSIPLDTAAECGASRVEGAARLRTLDDEITLAVLYTISVEVECAEASGCTKGQGYWKRHRDHPAWAPVLAESGAWFQRSGRSCRDVLEGGSRGLPYWQLAVAWVTARLNQEAGADASAIERELQTAARMLAEHRPTRIRGAEAAAWRALARILQDFNEGRVGPGACED